MHEVKNFPPPPKPSNSTHRVIGHFVRFPKVLVFLAKLVLNIPPLGSKRTPEYGESSIFAYVFRLKGEGIWPIMANDYDKNMRIQGCAVMEFVH